MASDIERKLGTLGEAAKFDASCSTAGSTRQNGGRGFGSGVAAGICHSWSEDGRCVALLKVLFTNACSWDCAYCRNRRSNDITRETFTVEELVKLTVDLYRRNYIEGLFLSSGVMGTPDGSMEKLVTVAKTLRLREGYAGYIHMKAIPGCDPALVLEGARWADRLSVNIELPSSASLARIAPDKSAAMVFGPMKTLAALSRGTLALPGTARTALPAPGSDRPAGGAPHAPALDPRGAPAFRPRGTSARGRVLEAGQTTQMIVGASPESDLVILNLAERLYRAYDVRRVYYSAYVPINADARLPALSAPPLLREHRLYQADWLFRKYGFSASEIVDEESPDLDPALDPKTAWALRHLECFPVELETADRERILRVPGIGPLSAERILRARRGGRLTEPVLKRLGVVIKRARWFVTAGGRRLERAPDPDERLRHRLIEGNAWTGQLEFDWGQTPLPAAAATRLTSGDAAACACAAEAAQAYGGELLP